MKEKTFDELIEPLKIGGFEGWYSAEFISIGKAKELLQQVRESTIEECKERIIELEGNIYRECITEVFDEFKTDRIKIKQ